MKIKKHFLLYTLLLIVCFSLSGCSPKKTESSNTNSDSSISIHSKLGSFYYDTDLFLENLQLQNKANNEVYSICNIPGCLHNTSDCLCQKYDVSYDFSAKYENHVLFMDRSTSKIYFIDIDGNNLTEVISLPGYNIINALYGVLVGNHYYVAAQLGKQRMDETGTMIDTSGIIRLYDFDMDSETCQILYESEETVSSSLLSNILYNDNYIYLIYQTQSKTFDEIGISPQDFYSDYIGDILKSNELLGIEYHSVVYNLKSNESHAISWENDNMQMPYFPCGFVNHTLFAYDDNGIYTYNVDTDVKDTYFSDSDYSAYLVYQSADFILLRYKYRNQFEYYIITEGDQEKHPMNHSLDMAFTILEECYNQLHIQYYDSSLYSVEFDRENSEYISRDEFKNWFK